MSIKPKYFRKNTSVKTIDIDAKEWFDRINGNSYFSANVVVNMGMKNEVCFSIPFTYGYGSYCEQRTFELLTKLGLTCERFRYDYWDNYVLRSHKQENCLKRDLKAHTRYIEV